jgi:hypothetical protein
MTGTTAGQATYGGMDTDYPSGAEQAPTSPGGPTI